MHDVKKLQAAGTEVVVTLQADPSVLRSDRENVLAKIDKVFGRLGVGKACESP